MQCKWTTSLNYLNWLRSGKENFGLLAYLKWDIHVFNTYDSESPSPFDLTCSSLIGCLSSRIAPCPLPTLPRIFISSTKRREQAWQNLKVEQNFQVSKFIFSPNKGASLFSTSNLSFVSQSAKGNGIHLRILRLIFLTNQGNTKRPGVLPLHWLIFWTVWMAINYQGRSRFLCCFLLAFVMEHKHR